jgi:hypothetical protein
MPSSPYLGHLLTDHRRRCAGGEGARRVERVDVARFVPVQDQGAAHAELEFPAVSSLALPNSCRSGTGSTAWVTARPGEAWSGVPSNVTSATG